MSLATYQEAYADALDYYNGDDLPAKTFVDKYALRDVNGVFEETTPDQMHVRLAKELHRIELKYPNPRGYEEILEALLRFKYLVPQGSPMYGIGNPHALVSLSNCFVVESPADDMTAIVEQGRDLANIMKRRGGVGIDISPLRPEGTVVNNAARTSTGAWSFADFYSFICRMIGQDGRRGALMISIDVRHPDVFKFATMKRDLKKVTGANVSIRLTDVFMRAVRDDKNFTLQWPIETKTPEVREVIRARDLWDVIVESVHASAEPGLLMWDSILRELPSQRYADVGFNTVSTNPCGEIPLSPEDACRLLAINLTGFVLDPFGPKAEFDFELFRDKVRLAQRMIDNVVDLELECVQRIIDKAVDGPERLLWEKIYKRGHEGRRTGLGTFGLADTLAQLKIRYDSDEALEVVERIYKALRDSSYEESVNMAEERGAFPVWDWEKEKNCPFIKRLPAVIRRRAAEVGRRNISNLTNAPTGSTSICSFNVSSGIEPVFRCVYTRRKKLTHNDDNSRVDFVDSLGDKWQEFKVFHSNVAQWLRLNAPDWDGVSLPPLPSFFVSSDEIDWDKRVRLQGVVQRYIDHSISSTINLPAGVPLETISELYLRSWEEGLKGVTIYVDGSRSGVLVTNTKDKDGRPTQITRTQAPRRPNVMPCDIYHGRVQGEPWTILVGLLNGVPYELFGGPASEAGVPKSVKSGYLEKVKLSRSTNQYNLSYSYYNDTVAVGNVGNLFENKTYGTFTRVLSLALRHGTPVQHIVEQLGKDKSEELNSLSNVLARALKRYIADGTVVTGLKEGCTRCGSNNIRYQEGCPVCLDCGFTKCK